MMVDKCDDRAHWARWATAKIGGLPVVRKRRARDVIRFDVGDVVVALRRNGEVWVCSPTEQGDLRWWLVSHIHSSR